MATAYDVSGAGTSAVNGTYTVDGVHGSKAKFTHTSGNYCLYYNRDVMANYAWVIDPSDTDQNSFSDCLYYQTPTGEDLPTDGSWNVGDGASSAPTVTEHVASGPANIDGMNTVDGDGGNIDAVNEVAYANIVSINGVE